MNNAFLTTNIGTKLIYNDNKMLKDKSGKAGPCTQFKEVNGGWTIL